MMPPSSNPYALAGGAGFALAGAACDLRWRRIPNRLTGSALLTALAVNTYIGGLRGLLDSLAACLLPAERSPSCSSWAVWAAARSDGAIAVAVGRAWPPAGYQLAGGVFEWAVAIARAPNILCDLFGWLRPRLHPRTVPPTCPPLPSTGCQLQWAHCHFL